MSMKIKIARQWKRTVKVIEHGDGVDETVEAKFVAVFRDLPPEEVGTAQQQIMDMLKPILDLKSKLLKAKTMEDIDVEQISETTDQLLAVTPMIERVLVAVEGVEIERPDGSMMSLDETLDFMRAMPKYRAAIMEVWEAEQPKVGLGNSLLSGGLSRA